MPREPMSDGFLVVLTTCPSRDEAEKLARLLVKTSAAACVSLLHGVESVYRWKGNVESGVEHMLLIKTTAACYPAVEQTIRQNHSYQVPEIIALSVAAGEARYLEWLAASCPDAEGKT